MRKWRLSFVLLLLVAPCLSQTVDQLSAIVVLLYRTEEHPAMKDGKPIMDGDKPRIERVTKYGTGFFVTPDGSTTILVTAEHVSTEIKSDFRIIARGESDTPLEMSSEQLAGTKDVDWITHGKEDVAVTILHPNKDTLVKLAGRFMSRNQIASDSVAPSRDRPLTALGFPLALGAAGHFSPISRDSKPVSGLITLPRFDIQTPATFFLLGDPSIAGFSGAPVFLIAAPYTTGQLLSLPASGTPTLCVGVVHGTISDDTGGKMAAITPSMYLLETIDKAMKQNQIPSRK